MSHQAPVLCLLVGGLVSAAASPARAEPYELSDCPEVTIVLEDPVEPDGTVGPKVAEMACEQLERLAPRFGLELTGHEMVRLMIADDPEAFHKHTGRGMRTQAIFSERTGIITQPAKNIRRMHRARQLGGLLAHELTHYLINQVAGQGCPMWLHEGLAQHFQGRPARGTGPTTPSQLAALELAWRAPKSAARTAWCYQQSLAVTRRLILAAGEAPLLAALPRLADGDVRWPALPIGDRSKEVRTLRAWLFPDDPGPLPDASADPERQIEIIRGGQPRPAPEGVTPLPLDQMLKGSKSGSKPAH